MHAFSGTGHHPRPRSIAHPYSVTRTSEAAVFSTEFGRTQSEEHIRTVVITHKPAAQKASFTNVSYNFL